MHLICAVLLSAISFLFPAEQKGKLVIKLDGVKETKGLIGIMLFDQEDGFPTEKEKALIWKEINIDNGVPQIYFDDLPLGSYAISLVHDVNANQELDKNFLGIPTEPFGFSGNKSILLGLPDFEEASIQLDQSIVESEIKLIDLL